MIQRRLLWHLGTWNQNTERSPQQPLLQSLILFSRQRNYTRLSSHGVHLDLKLLSLLCCQMYGFLHFDSILWPSEPHSLFHEQPQKDLFLFYLYNEVKAQSSDDFGSKGAIKVTNRRGKTAVKVMI